MIAEAIGQRFDQHRTAAFPCPLQRGRGNAMHGDDIIAVDLLAGNPGGDGLLRQSLRGALPGARH